MGRIFQIIAGGSLLAIGLLGVMSISFGLFRLVVTCMALYWGWRLIRNIF